jgi:hypothetical protein
MKYNKNVLNQDLQAQGKKAPNQYWSLNVVY